MAILNTRKVCIRCFEQRQESNWCCLLWGVTGLAACRHRAQHLSKKRDSTLPIRFFSWICNEIYIFIMNIPHVFHNTAISYNANRHQFQQGLNISGKKLSSGANKWDRSRTKRPSFSPPSPGYRRRSPTLLHETEIPLHFLRLVSQWVLDGWCWNWPLKAQSWEPEARVPLHSTCQELELASPQGLLRGQDKYLCPIPPDAQPEKGLEGKGDASVGRAVFVKRTLWPAF